MTALVYIGAVGRSGTTLLERTLATAPHAIALGEVVHLWERSVRDGEPCGCGATVAECPFWSTVGQRAFGGWDQVDVEEILRLRHSVDRNRYIPWLVVPKIAPKKFRHSLNRLTSTLEQLYSAISETAREGGGGDVVVIDSSKHPSYLFLLRSLTVVDVRLLHVVRDPRGVAHSWSRSVSRPETGDSMEQLGTSRAIARWTSHNLLFQLAGLTRTPRRRLSYEQFTEDPRQVGHCVDELCSTDFFASGIDVDQSCVTLSADHTVSGNPMRFRSGPTQIRSDQAWRDAMPRGTRRLVSTFTTPLRQLYSR